MPGAGAVHLEVGRRAVWPGHITSDGSSLPPWPHPRRCAAGWEGRVYDGATSRRGRATDNRERTRELSARRGSEAWPTALPGLCGTKGNPKSPEFPLQRSRTQIHQSQACLSPWLDRAALLPSRLDERMEFPILPLTLPRRALHLCWSAVLPLWLRWHGERGRGGDRADHA